MKDIENICEILGEGEVVVNDFGVLNVVLKHKNIKPILGINFTKTIKNSFLDNVHQRDITKAQYEKQKKLLTHLEFENREVREFYKNFNIGRFGIENSDFDLEFLDEIPRFQVDFYYPFITIANSKACDIAGSFDDERGYFVYNECPKNCDFASLEFKHSEILGLYQRYNSVYKTNLILDIPKIVYKNPKNRLVWELFI